MEIAMKLGSDICMQLDQCPGYPATRAYVERAVELSSMWAERCYKAHTRDDGFCLPAPSCPPAFPPPQRGGLRAIWGFWGGAVRPCSRRWHRSRASTAQAQAALSDGRRQPHHPRAWCGCGHRHVRLRAADAHRPHGYGVFERGSPQLPQRALCARRRSHRSHLHLPGVHEAAPARALIRHMVTQKEMLGGILLSMHNIYYLLQPYAACPPPLSRAVTARS